MDVRGKEECYEQAIAEVLEGYAIPCLKAGTGTEETDLAIYRYMEPHEGIIIVLKSNGEEIPIADIRVDDNGTVHVMRFANSFKRF